LPKKKLVDKRYAKSKEYHEALEDIENENKCPFCPENLCRQKKPIIELYRSGQWFITANNYSYPEARVKLIIIADEHKETITEVTAQEWTEIVNLIKWAHQEYDIKGAGLAVRYGDSNFTGATVTHLHFHLISAKLDKKNKSIPVNFPIG